MTRQANPWLGICASLLLLAWLLPAQAQVFSRGDPAPDFALKDSQGRTVTLASLRGRQVYLDFWASWCGPCRQTFPWMNTLQQRIGHDKLTVLAVNVDEDPAAAAEFLRQHPAGFTVLFDAGGRTAARYQLQGMPSSFLIGADGRLRWSHLGFRSGDGERLEAMLR